MIQADEIQQFHAPSDKSGRKRFKLSLMPTSVDRLYSSAANYRSQLRELTDELSELQQKLYAHNRYAVLILFQGIDASGKDGAIRHVMSGINPQGCHVHSFKEPSVEELSHDYLWRAAKRLPARGRIGIFNRSYYEEVLVVRVRSGVLEAQALPEELVKPKKIWQERFHDMVSFEQYLHRQGTQIIKIFLHLSKEEQRLRFLKRIDRKDKNWKLAPSDVEARDLWDDYMHAYEDCIRSTSHADAPWHVVPADDKKNARLIISRVMIETLKALPLKYPEADEDHRKALKAIRSKLVKES
jgi:PPK2 family polyphosphate:nucleotide phosphotransferase